MREGGVCLVNSHNKVGRRRLALAHELGHYLLQDEYTVDWRVTDGGVGLESRLDRFARALLLPAQGLREMRDVFCFVMDRDDDGNYFPFRFPVPGGITLVQIHAARMARR